VFYDNYEKEVLLGKNLYSYLADIYQNRAHFAVVFISKSTRKNGGQNTNLRILLHENSNRMKNICYQ